MEQIFPLLIWGGLFFLMMRFGCGAHMFGHSHGRKGHDEGEHHASGHGCCGSHSKRQSPPPHPEDAAFESIEAPEDKALPASLTDPVCGVRVSEGKGKTSFHAGRVYHFCSRECREIFEAAPETYVDGDGGRLPSPSLRAVEHRPQGVGRDHV